MANFRYVANFRYLTLTRAISRGQHHRETPGQSQKLGWVGFCKEIGFQLVSSEYREVAECTSSGKPFQIFEGLYAKMMLQNYVAVLSTSVFLVIAFSIQ